MRRAVTFDEDTWERLSRIARVTDRAEVSHVHRIVTLFMRAADPELDPGARSNAFADLVEYRSEVLQTLAKGKRDELAGDGGARSSSNLFAEQREEPRRTVDESQ